MNEIIEIEQPKLFEIRIAGHLSDQRAMDFEGLRVLTLENGESLISGEIKDQSQLFGILLRIRDIGVTLLAVNIKDSVNRTHKEVHNE